MLLRRLISLAAALVLACASTQTHAYAKPLQLESALPARVSAWLDAPGETTDVSPSRAKENSPEPSKWPSEVFVEIEEQVADGIAQAPWQLPNYAPDETGQAALLSNDGQSIGFTGYRKDEDTGLYYAQARWYDPLVGNFNGMDPAFGDAGSPVTFNKHLYANGNPLRFVDPTGRYGCGGAMGDLQECAMAYAWVTGDESQVATQFVGSNRGAVMSGGLLNRLGRHVADGAWEATAAVSEALGAQFEGLTGYRGMGYSDRTAARIQGAGAVLGTFAARAKETPYQATIGDASTAVVDAFIQHQELVAQGRDFEAGGALAGPMEGLFALGAAGRGLAKLFSGPGPKAGTALTVSEGADRSPAFRMFDPEMVEELDGAYRPAGRGLDVRHSPEIQVPFGDGIKAQGYAYENQLAELLPDGTRLPPNFKTYDFFFDDATRRALSAKTLDTTTPSRIADPSKLKSSLSSNVRAAQNFESYQTPVRALSSSEIGSRVVRFGVPLETLAEQWVQIYRAIQEAKERGVRLEPDVVTNTNR